MPDITLCSSEECPVRESCYRARAKPNKSQSWSNFEYSCNEISGFDEYIKWRGSKIWIHATKEEIENMTFDEACELIQKHIDIGHEGGKNAPREHFTHALEMVLNKAKEYMEEHNER